MAGLNEWHEYPTDKAPNLFENKDLIVVLNCFIVKFFPFSNLKTGSFPLPLWCFFRADRHLTGQQLLSENSNKSIKSPSLFLLFGKLTINKIEFSKNLTFSQVRTSQWLKLFSNFARISPPLKLPKKRVQAAAHTTRLLSLLQSEVAISWPSNFKRLRVITFLVCFGIFSVICLDLVPFTTVLVTKLSQVEISSPFSFFTVFMCAI